MKIIEIHARYLDWIEDKCPEEEVAMRRNLLTVSAHELGLVSVDLLDSMHFDLHLKICYRLRHDKERIHEEFAEIHRMFKFALDQGWIDPHYYPPKMI